MKALSFAKHLKIAALLSTAILLSSCNIFNLTGDSGSASSTESLVDEAYNFYRKANYAKALQYFNKAIAEDSTNTEAYLGAAKATLAVNKVNTFTILGQVKHLNTNMPFEDLSPKDIERNFNAIYGALVYIRELARRDSITIANPGNAFKRLSDRKIRYESISAGKSILEVALPILSFRKKTAPWGKVLEKDANGKLLANLQDVYADAIANIKNAESFNEALAELSEDFDNVIENVIASLESTINFSGLDDSDGTSETVVSKYLKEGSEDMQAQVLFYGIGDGIDNDGDGCIDEELPDGKDNDGDGIVDEDLRITVITRQSNDKNNPDYNIILDVTANGIDHNANGVLDIIDVAELQYEVAPENRAVSGNYLLKFASEATFKNTTDKDIKSKVAKDTDINNIQYSLEDRKRLVGGCWVNYDQKAFENWFKGRNAK